ncbi:MAG TPA: hypothetical protein GX727_01165 [Clostridium sp.]|jgi:hypothetical protein|nr:hypothetical protein [Clostridium sp.]
MKFKLFISSLFNSRNIGALVILMIVSLVANSEIKEGLLLPFSATSIAIYLALVIQSFTSKKFQDKFMRKMKHKKIKKLDKACAVLADDAKRHTNPAYYKKLCSIMNDKKEIMKLYYKEGPNFLNEKITEKTLDLVISYIKLLKSFCIRSKELGSIDVKPVQEKIAKNTRKLNFTSDPKVRENIENIIKMDEKVLSRLKDEKLSLERIDTRLDYIKSTVYMLKQQINLKIESEDMLDKIESAVNEAIALENVLDERNKRRIEI